MTSPKIAFVYDRINKMGGAERILMALHDLWPEAPFYTSVYDRSGASWADGWDIRASFLQKIPFIRKHHELFPFLMPLAFESFDFDAYDLVISITSAEAKGIITKPKTCHICYCLTPTRYLWSHRSLYENSLNNGALRKIYQPIFRQIISYLKIWDLIASKRPDSYLAISGEVQKRIAKYYQQKSTVIYPPVDIKNYYPSKDDKKGEYFLIVSRLVAYKRIDIAVNAFNSLGLPLLIIGQGMEEGYLKNIAKNNIRFLNKRLTDGELLEYYQKCLAVIFPTDEDFGIVPVEALACGKPVIAFKSGGALETIKEGIAGEYFYPQTAEALKEKVRTFNPDKYNPEVLRKVALKFNKNLFISEFKNAVERIYKTYQNKI